MEAIKDEKFWQDYQKLVDGIESITKNKKSFGYSYADLIAVYDEVKPKIKENNFVLVQAPVQENGVMRRRNSCVPVSKNKQGEISLTACIDWEIPVYALITQLVHIPSGKSIECALPLVFDDIDPQALGSSLTYMRRYSLFVLLGITTEDDDGLQASASAKFKQNTAEAFKPLPDDFQQAYAFLTSCEPETRRRYYGIVKNHQSFDNNQKSVLVKIIYPKA